MMRLRKAHSFSQNIDSSERKTVRKSALNGGDNHKQISPSDNEGLLQKWTNSQFTSKISEISFLNREVIKNQPTNQNKSRDQLRREFSNRDRYTNNPQVQNSKAEIQSNQNSRFKYSNQHSPNQYLFEGQQKGRNTCHLMKLHSNRISSEKQQQLYTLRNITSLNFHKPQKIQIHNIIDEYFQEELKINKNSSQSINNMNRRKFKFMQSPRAEVQNKYSLHEKQMKYSHDEQNHIKADNGMSSSASHNEDLSQSITLFSSSEGNNLIQFEPNQLLHNPPKNSSPLQSTFSFLPPIHQSYEEKQEHIINDFHDDDLRQTFMKERSNSMLSSPTAMLNTTNGFHPNHEMSNKIIHKILTHQNQAFYLFLVIENNKPQYRLKQYKRHSSHLSLELIRRQQKIKQIVNAISSTNNLPLPLMWREASHLSHPQGYALMSSPIPPLKDLLMKILVLPESKDERQQQWRIRPRPLHDQLMANSCQELCILVKDFCQQLKSVEGKVLNNKINLSNLFYQTSSKTQKPSYYQNRQEDEGKQQDNILLNRIFLGEWSYATFKDKFQAADHTFQKNLDPILFGQYQWFTSPEYLAPQILLKLIKNKEKYNAAEKATSFKPQTKDQEKTQGKQVRKQQGKQVRKQQGKLGHGWNKKEQDDLWSGSSDIWSLGLTIFEIVTLIPVWSVCKCTVVGKQRLPRSGGLAAPNRDLNKIHLKQLNIQKHIKKYLEQEVEPNAKLINLVLKMVEPDPCKRITLDQIIKLL